MKINEKELEKVFDFLIKKGFYCRDCCYKSCLHITKKELMEEIKKIK